MSKIVKLFGTDGIRGVANRWPLTPNFVVRLGQAVGQIIVAEGERPLLAVGRDTRLSGHMLENALAAGLLSQGVDTLHLGVLTTPGIAYLTTQVGARLGAVISASHNPCQDNGIKFFGPDGFKIPDEMEEEIEKMAQSSDEPDVDCLALGRRLEGHQRGWDYIDHLQSLVEGSRPFRGLRLALDCAHGATSEWAPALFERLGADLATMSNQPDGLNINESYEYLEPKSVRQAVLRESADVGVAFDGDGDRVILVDERGNFVDGDCIMAILARELKARKQLKNDIVVATVMSNLGLELSLREEGITLERTRVGDRYVTQRMVEGDFSLGGEQAGHVIIFGEGHTTGDGMYTALKVIETMIRRSLPLSRLAKCMRQYPQVLINVPVPSKPPLENIPVVQEQVQKTQALLGDQGRIVLRYSGTENLARVMIEGPDQETIEREAQAIAQVIEREIQ